MKIKTHFRINILVSICLAVAVAWILLVADREIDREMEKNFLADRISKGVFELFMVSNTYLTYHEERPREQWGVKLASLKKMIDSARAATKNPDENLEILSKRCEEMGALFLQITSFSQRMGKTKQKENVLVREAYERLITNLTAKGQEMVNHAFLLIQESNSDLSSAKKKAIVSVIVATLLAIAVSIAISILLSRRILNDTRLLQKGTEIVAGGNLDYRVEIQRDDEIGILAQAFDEMTRRLNGSYAALKAEITLRKEIEAAIKEREALLRTVLEVLPSGVWIADSEGNILQVNEAAGRIWEGVKYVGVKDYGEYKAWWADTGRRIESEEWALARALKTGETSTNEMIDIECFDGTRKTVLNSAAPFRGPEGEIKGGVVVEHDITELMAIERELKVYAEKLARSNRELEDFAFIASHDLQEPLRKIQTFGDRIKDKWGDRLGDEGNDYLVRMQNAAMRMQALIQGLLGYSRVTTRPEPFVPIALASVAHEVVADLALRIEQTGGRVEIEELPVIESSHSQMRQVFQNLFGNSLKYAGDKKPLIKVFARPAGNLPQKGADRMREWVEIVVEDNGIGFDEKYLDRIFQPFQRLHGRSQYEGTGIGLAICRKIVERHGGTLTAKSEPGKGAAFIMTLPVKQVSGEPVLPLALGETKRGGGQKEEGGKRGI